MEWGDEGGMLLVGMPVCVYDHVSTSVRVSVYAAVKV